MLQLDAVDIIYFFLGIDIPWIISLAFEEARLSSRKSYLQAVILFLIHPILIIIIKMTTSQTFTQIFTMKVGDYDLFRFTFFTALVAFSIASVIIWFKSRDSVTARYVDKKYLDFTESACSNQAIMLFAGDLSFLGNLQKCDNCNNNECLKDYIYQFRKKECKNCCFKKRQYRQLIKLRNEKHITLKLFCREPDGDDLHFRRLLGNLIFIFGKKVIIKFYDEDIQNNIYFLARIKKTVDRTDAMFWHWKIDTKKYQKPNKWKSSSDKKDPAGDTIFYLLNFLWDKFEAIDEFQKDALLKLHTEFVNQE